MLFFRWIRDSVRNAILGGVQDALEHMNQVAAGHVAEEIKVDPEHLRQLTERRGKKS